MHVTFRPMIYADLEGCVRLLPRAFSCEPRLRPQIPTLWREWLRQGSIEAIVLEDATSPEQKRLVAFGISAFVSGAFMEELRSGTLPPSPAAHVMQRALEERSPVLSLDAIRHDNSGPGLNLLVLHIGWDEAVLSSEELRWVKAKLLEAFGQVHAGYLIQEIMQEVYTEEEMRRGVAAGTRLRTDYSHVFSNGHPLPPPALRPFLVGIRREEVQDGCTVAPLFFYQRPRFYFKPWQQEMLRLALQGQSDAALSDRLHVSPSTVQKRWHAVYERAAAAPELFPSGMATGQSPQTRGSEKRRHLLAYLRQHPEELRPILPPKTRSQRTR